MTEKNDKKGLPKLTGASLDPKLVNIKPINTIDEAIDEIELSDTDVQSETIVNEKLFMFARSLINVELHKGRELSPIEKMNHVEKWWNKNSIPFQIDEEQKQKIINAILKAQLPLFESPLSHCKTKAEQRIVDQIQDEISTKKRNRLWLMYTLFELQGLEGPKTFFISGKKIQDELGIYSAKHWWEMLNELEFEGYIKKIKNGRLKGRKASEFIYIDHPCWSESKESMLQYEKIKQSASMKNQVFRYIKKYKDNMGLITQSSLT